MANQPVDWNDGMEKKPETDRRWTREDTAGLFLIPAIIGTIFFVLICFAGHIGGVVITTDRELAERLRPIVDEWMCEREGSGFTIMLRAPEEDKDQTSTQPE